MKAVTSRLHLLTVVRIMNLIKFGCRASVWLFIGVISGCGGAGEEVSVATGKDDEPSSQITAKAFVTTSTLARDALVLLVPDATNLESWETKVWVDTAADEGYRLQVLSTTDFLSLGTQAASKIRALVMPDSAYVSASDQVITALTTYTRGGGNLMLVYDAGMLTESGFYAAGKSRLSALAGVDYGLYDTLADRIVGIGGIVATDSRLRSLSFPPGKSIAYKSTATGSSPIAQLKSASENTRRYLPADVKDPGGQKRAINYTKQRPGVVAQESTSARRAAQSSARSVVSSVVRVFPDQSAFKLADAIEFKPSGLERLFDSIFDRPEFVLPKIELNGKAPVTTVPAPGNSLQIVSGYNYANLDYYTFVTKGTYNGDVLVASPDFGVVAGRRKEGLGNVLFVNTPLGYFKAIGTDSLPIHGFLNYFAGTVASLPKMSTQPKGIGSMVYNWHVDDGDDLTVDSKALLDNGKVFNRGPFSVHFTTGPDTVVIGDKLGQNLANNATGRALVRRIGNIGEYAGRLPVQHELGPHGGWSHDVYGNGVNETNSSQYLPYLENNFSDISSILGRAPTEYSAPQGNNPLWALSWMQDRGVVGYYYVGDVGSGPVRAYRNGVMGNPKMWAFPVTPFGISATFEEFEERNISDATTLTWLSQLQDFVVNNRTNRMFYNHPPGAVDHLTGVVIPMLDRADALKAQGKFQWVTMTQQANFLTKRNAATWQLVSDGKSKGTTTITVSHPSDLKDITWLIPKTRYGKPVLASGIASVTDDTSFWIIVAGSGKNLRLTASEK